MINSQRRYARRISMILVFSMVLSLLYVQPIYAVSDSDVIASILEYEVDAEEVEEAKADAISSYSNMDWKTATEVDKLPWNYFHNRVEEHIVQKYSDNGIEKELTIRYRYSDKDEELGIGQAGELTGSIGKADLYLYVDSMQITYLWEIKPISYRYDPKKQRERLN